MLYPYFLNFTVCSKSSQHLCEEQIPWTQPYKSEILIMPMVNEAQASISQPLSLGQGLK